MSLRYLKICSFLEYWYLITIYLREGHVSLLCSRGIFSLKMYAFSLSLKMYLFSCLSISSHQIHFVLFNILIDKCWNSYVYLNFCTLHLFIYSIIRDNLGHQNCSLWSLFFIITKFYLNVWESESRGKGEGGREAGGGVGERETETPKQVPCRYPQTMIWVKIM